MDQMNTHPDLHLAVARLLDSIEARPRSHAEFDAAKTKSLRHARAALKNKPMRHAPASHDWLRAAARLGRALDARRKDHALRLAADFLDLPRLCAQETCHRAQSCRGAARDCLKQSAPRVPEAVRASIVALSERIARGDSPELAVALLPFESKAALWAWWRVIMSNSKRKDELCHARPCAGHPRLSEKRALLRRGWPGQARP